MKDRKFNIGDKVRIPELTKHVVPGLVSDIGIISRYPEVTNMKYGVLIDKLPNSIFFYWENEIVLQLEYYRKQKWSKI